MNKMYWKWTLVCAAALVGATVLLNTQAWAGKPVPPPPPTLLNPTAIKYQIQFWQVPTGGSGVRLYQTNNLGMSVGYFTLSDGDSSTSDMSHAILHDPAATDPTTALDLHAEMAACQPALFYEGAVLDGWVIASATDINDDGVIVGYLFPEGSPWSFIRLGYTLDTHASPDAPLPDPALWTFALLPTDAWVFSYPRQINENGDIAGVYRRPEDQTSDVYFIPAGTPQVIELGANIKDLGIHLNNPDPVSGRAAQVAALLSDGTAFCWTTSSDVPQILSGLISPSVTGINDFGTICGATKLSKKSNFYPMRYNTSLEILSGVQGGAVSINSAGDLAAYGGDTPKYLYHDSWGFVELDALIDPDDPNAAAWLSSRGYGLEDITDRIATTPTGGPATQFGLVSGTMGLFDQNGVLRSYGYLLTPVKK